MCCNAERAIGSGASTKFTRKVVHHIYTEIPTSRQGLRGSGISKVQEPSIVSQETYKPDRRRVCSWYREYLSKASDMESFLLQLSKTRTEHILFTQWYHIIPTSMTTNQNKNVYHLSPPLHPGINFDTRNGVSGHFHMHVVLLMTKTDGHQVCHDPLWTCMKNMAACLRAVHFWAAHFCRIETRN